VPRLGGTSILFTVIVVVAGWGTLCHIFHRPFPYQQLRCLTGPTILIFALGLWDDFHSLTPSTKFSLQAVAAVWLFLNGYNITRFQLLFRDRPLSSTLSLALTVFWILLVTNAFNLLDGLDGLAAGSALFSILVVFITSLTIGNTVIQVVTISLAGAIGGFLRYNFNPATIFMGDCGSLVTGFLLAAVSIAGSQKASATIAVGIPILSFGLPLLDTAMAILRRLLNRRSLFSADGEHIHHKLLERGFSPRQAVIVLYAVSAIFGLVSLLLLSRTAGVVPIALTVIGIGIFFALQHLGYHEIDELRRVARNTWEQKTTISNNLAMWRAVDEMARARTSEELCRILRTAIEANDCDGFAFSFTPEITSLDGSPKSRRLRGSWRRQLSRITRRWTLRLDLTSEHGAVCGYFTVTRSYRDHTVRNAFDCLTVEFVAALSTALQRIGENYLRLVSPNQFAKGESCPLKIA
jgi:UDP-GlcNAc:undecaprenyl-phosphate GlcNAc-1-phosphate transferase